MRRHENLRYGGRFGPTEIVWDSREMIFRNSNKLGLSAATDDSKDSIADFPTANFLADRFNFTGELQSRNFLGISRRRGIASEPLQDVRTIQSRRAHPHADAIGCWLRCVGDLADFEAFNTAEGSDRYCAHFQPRVFQ